MSWFLIITLSLLVFINRYLFLEPNLRLQLPSAIHGMLYYAAPCLLSAICIPVIFFDQQHQFRTGLDNAYVWAALLTALCYLISKRILLSSAVGFVLFYALFLFKQS